jgi:hypothetical protein
MPAERQAHRPWRSSPSRHLNRARRLHSHCCIGIGRAKLLARDAPPKYNLRVVRNLEFAYTPRVALRPLALSLAWRPSERIGVLPLSVLILGLVAQPSPGSGF